MNLIDLPLVFTQIVGFLLLVWGLRRYAWGPLIKVLEDRRQKIIGELDDAARRNAEALALKAKYEQELRVIDVQARQRLQAGVVEGQKVAAEIKAQAQRDAQERLKRADEDMAREREKAKEVLREHMVDLSLRAAEKILRQKLDEPAQRRLAGEFIDELGATR